MQSFLAYYDNGMIKKRLHTYSLFLLTMTYFKITNLLPMQFQIKNDDPQTLSNAALTQTEENYIIKKMDNDTK
jgi:hypothetical protein